jgi:hypothetical protein
MRIDVQVPVDRRWALLARQALLGAATYVGFLRPPAEAA